MHAPSNPPKTTPPAQPLEGDFKLINGFAWLPEKINGKRIWLRRWQRFYEWRIIPRPIVWFRGMPREWIGKKIICGNWDLIGEKVL